MSKLVYFALAINVVSFIGIAILMNGCSNPPKEHRKLECVSLNGTTYAVKTNTAEITKELHYEVECLK